MVISKILDKIFITLLISSTIGICILFTYITYLMFSNDRSSSEPFIIDRFEDGQPTHFLYSNDTLVYYHAKQYYGQSMFNQEPTMYYNRIIFIDKKGKYNLNDTVK